MSEKKEYEYGPVATNENGAEVDAVRFNTESNGVTILSQNTMVSQQNHNSQPGDKKFLYLAACAANLAAFTCGQAFGWTSPEIPILKSNGTENPLGQPINPSQEGWIGSFLPLGAMLGPFAAGMVADSLGRKKTLLVGTTPFLATFLLGALGGSVNMYYLSRFLAGLAVGCIFTVLPMYIGEISDNETRGQLGSFMQLFIVVGLLFSYALGPYLPFATFNYICLGIPVVFLIYFFMRIPESPYFLVLSGNCEAAIDSLVKLRSKSRDSVQKEIEEIKLAVDDATTNKKSFFDIFKERSLTMALVISVSLVALQQFSGINIVLFYAQDIFTNAGVSLAPEICTILIGIVQVIASGVTPMLVERKGKRFLLLLSAVGMAISQGALGYFFYVKDGGNDVSNLSWLPVASLVLYIIAYCLGFGPLPWAVMGELFPGEIKAAASTVTASGCWLLGFLITKYFNVVTELIGTGGSFGFFAACCLFAAGFVWKCVPETSGKSVQEILDILGGNTKA
ncbi:unnamed protein product [Brassicogethes aeneus]|uniref:Major facilitator superfamily (MFS) profile domain-containing protein n=1 Tax=Brassicogethes aeneus TaxID=1431903 RepID=A0A9P0FJB4_BRAAE|nr:unnamed protein product [Brassicogethes aeneus]